MPLITAVHAINTTVSTLHGLTPMEVVLGRPVNERSILLAKKRSGEKSTALLDDLDILNDNDKVLWEKASKSIHAIFCRVQKRQTRAYNKRWLQKEPVAKGDKVVIRDHRHGKKGKKYQTAILPSSKSLFYVVS